MIEEQNDNSIDISDILGADLTDVSATFPVLKAGTKRMKVVSLKGERTKDGQGVVLLCGLKTTELEPTTDGKEVPPGHPVMVRIGLTPSEKYTQDMIDRKLKNLKVAAGGSEEGSFGDPAEYIGAEVLANVIVEIDKSGQYPPKNTVRNFVLESGSR